MMLLVAVAPANATAARLVVRFAPGAERGEVRRNADARVLHAISSDTQVVTADDASAALRSLSADRDVRWAERDVRVHASADDPRYPEQWNLPLLGAPTAWQVTTGDPGVTIAVLDTGVAFGHPDLAPNLWTNADEVAGNGVDDDGNGLVD